jgi:hypothetical protein
LDKSIEVDFAEMEHKLKFYIDKGRIALGSQVKEEPLITVKPDASLMRPLKKVTTYMGSFIAIDCSTRTLKRANNWGIYLMRASCASVRERTVDWSYSERICTVVGDSHVRRSYLQDFRIELESQVALQMLKEQLSKPYHVHGDVRSMYLLLDGGGYFGGEREYLFMRNARKMVLDF